MPIRAKFAQITMLLEDLHIVAAQGQAKCPPAAQADEMIAQLLDGLAQLNRLVAQVIRDRR